MATCGFDLAWIGPCKNPVPCMKHDRLSCCAWHYEQERDDMGRKVAVPHPCGQPAVWECFYTSKDGVCGRPLCADHWCVSHD